MKPETMERGNVIKRCVNSNCAKPIRSHYLFCPFCGQPQGEEERLIISKRQAYKALQELKPFEFMIFMLIYFETQAIGLDWKEMLQKEVEQTTKISHPKVGDSICLLEDGWIIREKRSIGWYEKNGFGIDPEL